MALAAELKNLCEQAKKSDLANHLVIYNAALFSALLEQDLSAYSKLLYMANSKWHQQFAARGMAVLLYEGTDDMLSVFGKNYRLAMSEIGLEERWFKSLNSEIAKINGFKNNHRKFLEEIRLYVGAHREQDALVQLNVLESLDHMKVYRLAASFSDPLRKLITFQTELLDVIREPSTLLRALLKAAK